jgi:hypothetical protein
MRKRTNFYQDTPQAAEAVRRRKNRFVEKTGQIVVVMSTWTGSGLEFRTQIVPYSDKFWTSSIEHYSVAEAMDSYSLEHGEVD